MRVARIENNVVVDLWEVNSIEDYPDLILIEATEDASIGWGYDGTNFTDVRTQSEIDTENQEVLNFMSLEYLTETDWYVIRKFETGTAIPQEILIKRQEAREAIV
tara:strand:+ start:165 stop:479 length:315 start_codon:yes stop_codon:yes gene_type:complete